MFSISLLLLVATLAAGAIAVNPNASSGETPAPPNAERPLPASVDLRPQFHRFHLEPRRQGSRGTCSVFTVVGALEYAVARKQGAGTRLSVEYLNWAGHRAANRTADGGFFSELWKGYEASGICAETDLPYRPEYDPALQPPPAAIDGAQRLQELGLRMQWIKEWNPETGLTDDQLTAIKRTLSKRWPVCGGFRWPKQARWERDVLQMCPPDDVFDGHSVLLVGYRDDAALPGGGIFLIRNSGGDGRDGFLPYAYARSYMNDALWIETQTKAAGQR